MHLYIKSCTFHKNITKCVVRVFWGDERIMGSMTHCLVTISYQLPMQSLFDLFSPFDLCFFLENAVVISGKN